MRALTDLSRMIDVNINNVENLSLKHFVVIIYGFARLVCGIFTSSYTKRINPSACPAFNTDFDGDEMNIFRIF